MMSAPTYKDLDMSKLSFSNALTNKNGGKYVVVSHDGARLHFQLGLDEKDIMLCPFGLSTEYCKDDVNKVNLDVNLNDTKKEFVQKIEEIMIQEAILNSADWFKKKIDEAAIRSMHTSVIKVASKPEFPERLRVKVTVKGNEQTTIYVAQIDDGRMSYRLGSTYDLTKNVKMLPILKGSV